MSPIRNLLPVMLACTVLSACSTVGKTLDRINIFKDTPSAPAADDDTARVFAQFGRFAGSWKCTGEQLGESGWVPQPGTHTWRWVPILDGTAMQDFWISDPQISGPRTLGTHVRIWNRERERWEIAWTSNQQQEWDLIWAEEVDGNMVMHTSRPARSGQPAHVARITIFDITPDSFRWKYEAAPLTKARNYTEQARMSCTRD